MRQYASLRGKLRICIVAWSHLSAKDINLSWGSELRPSQAKPSLVGRRRGSSFVCVSEMCMLPEEKGGGRGGWKENR